MSESVCDLVTPATTVMHHADDKLSMHQCFSQAGDADDKLGLADAGWLHCLHEAEQGTEETDADAHHESSPTHTAAPLAENRALLNRPPGLPAQSSTGTGST